ncbi:Serine/threonine-protein kinase SKY1 [Pseudocercospora fuligena]|uniref:Serine/threonine-protein kinase SKY1 n=1 Tax=Pseudocercospora fuligena TaxID=685502 RepID=A0A8H6RM11_9PEZI|nr:Serine/threonine-protein kinase SKY1 [Pseudocercospora fuligena]
MHLKEENILMTFEDGAVLEDYVKASREQPVTAAPIGNHDFKTTTADFGKLRPLSLLPTLTDFGLSEVVDGDYTSRRAIQPPAYHAPEVLLGIPWSYSADIWNLGVLIWNLMEGKDLFADLNTNNGKYHPRLHLAQMVTFLGKPPKQLLDREREWRHVPYDERALDGEIITPCESFGGPFFDEKGEFIFADLFTTQRRLSDTVTALEGDEKRSFLDLISRMLRWVPEERESAKELLEHSWLQQEE